MRRHTLTALNISVLIWYRNETFTDLKNIVLILQKNLRKQEMLNSEYKTTDTNLESGRIGEDFSQIWYGLWVALLFFEDLRALTKGNVVFFRNYKR